MRLSEILHLVWINILENKFKVMLTALGIVVGSATIVLVIAIGHGGELDVEDQFKNLNAGAIEVTVGSNESELAGMEAFFAGGMPNRSNDNGPSGSTSGGMPGGAGGSMPGGMGGGMPGGMGASQVTLSTDDVNDIVQFVPDVTSAAILTSGTAAVLAGDLEEETDYTVVGVLPEYKSISNLEVLVGDFITDYDQEDKSKVAVLGYDIAVELFGSAYYACGDVMTIEGKTYDIIGVLSSMGTVSSGISPDSAIYVPYSTGLKYVFGSSAELQISVVASDVSKVNTVMTNIEAILTQNYPSGAFTLTDAGSKMEAATASADTLSALLIAVASIVFIVGGIGIMNVLFVTVKERTQEIGILKALGSSRQEILLEFLLEANFISLLGGVLGVATGFAIVPIVRLTGMRIEPLAIGGVLALIFAIITGTVFGFYPAYKASVLVPIEALNQE